MDDENNGVFLVKSLYEALKLGLNVSIYLHIV